MLTIRYRPEAATTLLMQWLRPRVRYDADGRFSLYLVDESPMPPELRRVARIVCPEIDADLFRGVILQAYRDGRATTPCHSDVHGGFILSLGATRTLRLHRGSCDEPSDWIDIECVNGTAILMDEAFHAGWHHQLVPNPAITEERLSLVFRTQAKR